MERTSAVNITIHHSSSHNEDTYLVGVKTGPTDSKWDTISITQHPGNGEIVWSGEISIDDLIEYLKK